MPENKQARPVALITGSGKPRIGNQIARALGKRGYQIALHYNNSKREASQALHDFRETGIEAEAFQAAMSQEYDVNRLFDSLRERFGRLDVLVTAASVWDAKSLEDTTADDVMFNFRVNARGTFLCARRAGLIMAEQETGGSIVTFGDWAIERPYRDHAAYFLSKGAVSTLTKVMAVELAFRNPRIRVNCIHPGPVMAPPGLSEQERQARVDSTLVKRADNPQSVVQTVLYFVENPFVTGVCLPVDGGRTVYSGDK